MAVSKFLDPKNDITLTIETNIIYSEENIDTENFGLIDKWRFIEEKKGELDIGMVEVTLPDWLYQALYKKKMLKISPDYFRIRKAIDRRIYEIARKHCGNQGEFTVSIEKLHIKAGSSAITKMFRHNVKQLAKTSDLPDYSICFDLKADNWVMPCLSLINKIADPGMLAGTLNKIELQV